MLTFRNLIPYTEEFLLGDDSTKKILDPNVVAIEDVLDARVANITAKDNIPVIWLDFGKAKEFEDILEGL